MRAVILLSLLLFASCQSKIEGTYICHEDASLNKKESSDRNVVAQMVDAFKGWQCVYDSLEFKGNNTVIIKTFGIDIAANYTRDKEYIKIQAADGQVILLKVKNNATLVGESFPKGVYVKRQ